MRRNAFTVGRPVPVLAALLALLALGAPAFAASNDWSRVTRLEKFVEVRVELRDGQSHGGRVVAADSYSLTVRSRGEDQPIPRDQVQRVTRITKGSSVPAVTAAVAAGIAVGAALAYGCSGGRGSCSGDLLVPMVGIPVSLGYLAHWRTSTERRKVVYEAAPVRTFADRPTDWEAIQRALPPSLQGVR